MNKKGIIDTVLWILVISLIVFSIFIYVKNPKAPEVPAEIEKTELQEEVTFETNQPLSSNDSSTEQADENQERTLQPLTQPSEE